MKTLNQILEFLKDNLQLVVAVILVAGLSSYAGMCSQQDDIDKWRDRYNNYRESTQEIVDNYPVLQDSLANIQVFIDAANDSIDNLNENLDQRDEELANLDARIDSLRGLITDQDLEVLPPNIQTYIATLEETVEIQEVQIDSLNARDRLRVRVINDLTLQNDLLSTQLDSVVTILEGTPEDPGNPNKILGFIPKPTRTQSFLAGVGLTLLTVLVVGN